MATKKELAARYTELTNIEIKHTSYTREKLEDMVAGAEKVEAVEDDLITGDGQDGEDGATVVIVKRRLLNPQNKINAKVKALAAVGASLIFDRNERLWFVDAKEEGDGLDDPLIFTSKQLSQMTPEQMVKKFEKTQKS